MVLPTLAQKGITSKSEQNSFEQNRFCVFSGVNKGNSRNMWFCLHRPRKVFLPSQSKTVLNIVFPVALKVIPETCGLAKLAHNGTTSKSRQNSFEQNRFCVSSCVKGNSRNMWFGQDWPTTVLLPSQGKTALIRTVFVFPAAFKSNSQKMCFCQDWPRTVLLPSQSKQLWTELFLCFQWRLKVIPKNCGFAKTSPDRYSFQVKASSFEQNRFCVPSGV